MNFGRGMGCGVSRGECSKTPNRREFCQSTPYEPVCSRDNSAKGYCSEDYSMDNCPIISKDSLCRDSYFFFLQKFIYMVFIFYLGDDSSLQPSQNLGGETYTLGSKCVIGNVSRDGFIYWGGRDRSLCYKFSCSDDKSQVFLFPNGGKAVTCRRAGERVTMLAPHSGTIICPDPADYCKFYFRFI
jgi:hypothetical protein